MRIDVVLAVATSPFAELLAAPRACLFGQKDSAPGQSLLLSAIFVQTLSRLSLQSLFCKSILLATRIERRLERDHGCIINSRVIAVSRSAASLEMVGAATDDRLDNGNHTAPSNGIGSKDSKPLSLGILATSNLHTLALLSDSALPLGSFAFSSGLESFLAHRKLDKTRPVPPEGSFQRFLKLSLSSLASTALPYVLAAHRHPENIEQLDNDFDASTPCTVARRASVAQGRAFLSVWERCFVGHVDLSGDATLAAAAKNIKSFAVQLKATGGQNLAFGAHFAPLWGLITRILGIDEQAAAYLFLFSHARTITSAGVRASELGPYQAQSELASQSLRDHIEQLLLEHWDKRPEDAAQTVPALDLWVGRHEKLYSRIFNS